MQGNVICSYCNKTIGCNPIIQEGKLSHGVCPTCRDRVKEEFYQDMKTLCGNIQQKSAIPSRCAHV